MHPRPVGKNRHATHTVRAPTRHPSLGGRQARPLPEGGSGLGSKWLERDSFGSSDRFREGEHTEELELYAEHAVAMTFATLHPEALLEKEASGTLDDREKAQLESHREQCEACRFEQKIRSDFANELAAAEPATDAHGWTERVTGAGVAPSGAGNRRVRPRVMTSVASLTAAAVVFITGAGLGASLGGRFRSRFAGAQAPLTNTTSVPEREAPASASADTFIAADPKTGSEETLPPVARDLVEAPASVQTTTARSRISRPPPPSSSPHPESSEPSAASLFEAEGNARRKGDYVQALSFHRDLEARFSSSMEAQASRAIIGRGLLDRGRAEDALACFDRYLALGSGDLGEDVMSGRATALERLERTDEARAAWRRLLETYPTTAYAPHAMARLEGSSEL